MDVFTLSVEFKDEERCRLHYKAQWDKEGITCKRCGSTSHYCLKNKWAYQCKSCQSRQTSQSGTIMGIQIFRQTSNSKHYRS